MGGPYKRRRRNVDGNADTGKISPEIARCLSKLEGVCFDQFLVLWLILLLIS